MLLLALIFLVFSAVYFYYPRITGRELNAPAGYADLAGMPGRYIDYSSWTYAYIAGPTNYLFKSINPFRWKVIILLAFAQLVFVVNFHTHGQELTGQ
jgi:heme/copper-type cytochrome/quinol oxidase subunit 1